MVVTLAAAAGSSIADIVRCVKLQCCELPCPSYSCIHTAICGMCACVRVCCVLAPCIYLRIPAQLSFIWYAIICYTHIAFTIVSSFACLSETKRTDPPASRPRSFRSIVRLFVRSLPHSLRSGYIVCCALTIHLHDGATA